MSFMNEYDRATAVQRFFAASKPNRLGAALVIANLADWTDSHSDGWAYWTKPSTAAKRLVALVYPTTNADVDTMVSTDATDAELAAAMRPVKAFCTRQQKETDYRGRPMMTADEADQILRGGEVL